MRFYTSDLHLGHKNMIPYCGRPWVDVEAMNAGLLQRWNAVVGTEDEVYILGDLTLKNPAPNGQPAPWLVDWLAAANGTKKLIVGNHDRAWGDGMATAGRGEQAILGRWAEAYAALGFESVYTYGWARIGSHTVWMSHLPDTITGHEHVAAAEYEMMVPGRGLKALGWRMHGHVHTQWQQNGREINVGVDAWNGQPVPEWVIERLIDDGPCSIPAQPWIEDEAFNRMIRL